MDPNLPFNDVLRSMGLLGDRESLDWRLADDERSVRGFGLSHADIADRMTSFRRHPRATSKDGALIEGRYQIQVMYADDIDACPWGDIKILGWDTTVSAPFSSISYSDMQVHWIRTHGFYGGKDTFKRLEPEKLVKLLGLTD